MAFDGRVLGIEKLDSDELAILVDIDDHFYRDATRACALLTRFGEIQIPEPGAAIAVGDLEIHVVSVEKRFHRPVRSVSHASAGNGGSTMSPLIRTDPMICSRG